MKRARTIVKRLLGHSPVLFHAAQCVYHEAKFVLSRFTLSIKYPGLKIVRYSRIDLKQQSEMGFRSQFGQDFFVYSEFFRNRQNGYFLDIGCNRPEYMNNTFFFEQRLGWSGVACDPINRYRADWAAQRSATFVPIALGAEKTKREFVEIANRDGWADMLSAFTDKVRPEALRYGYKSYVVTVRRISDVLREQGVEQIDFASIDVEGAEMDVLLGLNTRVHGPHVILVENTTGLLGDHHLRAYLISQGYRFYARICSNDDVFVRNDR